MFEPLFLHVLDALIKVTKSLALTSPAQQEQTWQEQNIECFKEIFHIKYSREVNTSPSGQP